MKLPCLIVRRGLVALAFALFSLGAGSVRADAPRIAASIPPLHSLASAVMADVAPVALLLPAGHSPHEGGLAPSTLRDMAGADLVLWSGPGLEAGLVRAIGQLPAEQVITLTLEDGLHLLPPGGGEGEGENHAHDHGQDDDHGHDHGHDHGAGEGAAVDPHLWLSSENALAIVDRLVDWLVVSDVDNAARYRDNGAHLRGEIEDLRNEIDARIAGVRELPFIVFHDAYRYFVEEYGLNQAAAVTLNPVRVPGARRLSGLRALVQSDNVLCVFAEPQFEPRALAVIREGSGARTGILDPLGVGLETGPTLWFQLMRAMGESLAGCLSGGGS